MLKRSPSLITMLLWSGVLAGMSSGCRAITLFASTTPGTQDEAVASAASVSVPATSATPVTPVVEAPVRIDPYEQAIIRAAGAFNLSQSAQSQDDWRLVASRWQQAMHLMSSVPTSNPNHSQAQSKLREDPRNLAYAQRQVNRSTSEPDPGRILVRAPIAQPYGNSERSPITAPLSRSGTGEFYAPIVRRMGGTPVINVMFNGNQNYEMIVDTGASGTVITQGMAAALGVVPVGEARVDTASSRDVTFSLGYVQSVEVGGVTVKPLVVAVAGPNLSIGLLGHDFFGNYDVTIRQDRVEFRQR